MPKFYFSFGSGHHDTHGRTLDGYYTIIEADTEVEARNMYIERFGSKWSGTYDEDRGPEIVKRWGWEFLPFPWGMEDLCSQLPQTDAVKLFGANSFRNRYPHTREEAIAIIERLQADFEI